MMSSLSLSWLLLGYLGVKGGGRDPEVVGHGPLTLVSSLNIIFFRLPAEPQVPREGGWTLFHSPPGRPQLVTTIWTGLSKWQQPLVP